MKKKIIELFLHKLDKDTGGDVMPLHLWQRWYGLNSRFYNKLWKKFDGDYDPYLFDDFCEIGFDVNYGNGEKIDSLEKPRLNKLYKFAKRMLIHYFLVSCFWASISFLIRKVAYPISTFLSNFWHDEETLF